MRKFVASLALLAAALVPGAVIVTATSASAAPTSTSAAAAVAQRASATVCARDLYLRNRPGGNPVATLYRNAKVNVLAWSGKWALVDSSKGRGWVDGTYLC